MKLRSTCMRVSQNVPQMSIYSVKVARQKLVVHFYKDPCLHSKTITQKWSIKYPRWFKRKHLHAREINNRIQELWGSHINHDKERYQDRPDSNFFYTLFTPRRFTQIYDGFQEIEKSYYLATELLPGICVAFNHLGIISQQKEQQFYRSIITLGNYLHLWSLCLVSEQLAPFVS